MTLLKPFRAWEIVKQVSLAAVLVLAACKGGPSASDGAVDGKKISESGATDKFPTVDFGPLAGYGRVEVRQSVPGYNVWADFRKSADGSEGGCNTTTIGPCDIETCPGASTDPVKSAGSIQIAGLTKPLSLEWGTDKYAPLTASGTLFSGGESVTIRAAGADVPAFSRQHVAPSAIELTEPIVSTVTWLSRTQSFVARWNGTSKGRLLIAFVQGAETQLRCFFDVALRTGVVPTQALVKLKPDTMTSIVPLTEDRQVAVESHWRIRTYLRAPVTQQGKDVSMSVKAQ